MSSASCTAPRPVKKAASIPVGGEGLDLGAPVGPVVERADELSGRLDLAVIHTRMRRSRLSKDYRHRSAVGAASDGYGGLVDRPDAGSDPVVSAKV